MRRVLATVLIALGTAGAIGFAPAASAAEVEEIQPAAVAGRFWIFEWSEYTGSRKSYNSTDRDFRNDVWDGESTSVDNQTTSAQNLTNQWGTLHDIHGSCSGDSFPLPPGYGVRNLGPAGFNNKASCIVFG
ncbi:hypothetical protein ABZX40_38320 [Streptomyces sp. NPDC004610]|uniref:hypothetical protein n=1 Tax=unclassified Streptomyces TaxID=2593676 RepID=UPI0033BF0948